MLYGIYAVITNKKIVRTEEEVQKANYEELQLQFKEIFDNKTHNNSSHEIEGIDYNNLIGLLHELKGSKPGKYDIDVKIPQINIDSENAKKINESIEKTYVPKIVEVGTESEVLSIYSVNYVAYINNNILSLVIKSTLKSGSNPQKIMIQTVSLNLETDEILTIEDAIAVKNISKEEVQKKINEEITKVAKEKESIAGEGFNVYRRNSEDEMYKIENTSNFFLGQDGHLYIVYAYGNKSFTAEMDVVIF